MALPKVNVSIQGGNLGRTNPSEDGVTLLIASGVAVAGQFDLGAVLGPFRSPADAEALTINAAYDVTNTCLLYQHIKDFYDQRNNSIGVELYVLPVAKTVTMAQMTDIEAAHISKVTGLEGKIRQVIITRVPDGAYTPSYTDQLENDIITAIGNAQDAVDFYEAKHIPISVVIEGRNVQTTYGSLSNLRGASAYNADRVMVVIGQDADVAAVHAQAAKYAMAGYVAGKLAGIPVQRNIGRVKDGPVRATRAALSSGALMTTISDTIQDALHDKGYVFLRRHPNKAGWFFNDDPVAESLSSDFAFYSDGRVIDKALRIAVEVYTEELMDDVVLTEAGKLPASQIKQFQSLIEDAISRSMGANGEISGVSAYCDPEQVVATTSEIAVELNIFKVGTNRKISVTLGFAINTN